jgi:hypothetical protein
MNRRIFITLITGSAATLGFAGLRSQPQELAEVELIVRGMT